MKQKDTFVIKSSCMKKILFALIGLSLAFSLRSQAQTRVDIYYFHITNRCSTCINIESYVRKTIDTYFTRQVAEGQLVLHVLNCEKPENKAIAEKYVAYGSTLVITRINQGSESSEDITGWAFQKVRTPDAFVSELKVKIETALR